MTLKKWLDKGLLQKIETTHESLEVLLQLVKRDIKDSQIKELSDDRRFATAYCAALGLINYVIRKQGYRVLPKHGHHQNTLEIAKEILGKEAKDLINYFDLCRRKRNKVDYNFINVVSHTEVEELIQKVEEFMKLVLA